MGCGSSTVVDASRPNMGIVPSPSLGPSQASGSNAHRHSLTQRHSSNASTPNQRPLNRRASERNWPPPGFLVQSGQYVSVKPMKQDEHQQHQPMTATPTTLNHDAKQTPLSPVLESTTASPISGAAVAPAPPDASLSSPSHPYPSNTFVPITAAQPSSDQPNTKLFIKPTTTNDGSPAARAIAVQRQGVNGDETASRNNGSTPEDAPNDRRRLRVELRRRGSRDADASTKGLESHAAHTLAHLTPQDLDALWKKYDADGNGKLRRNEISKLAEDLIDKVEEFVSIELRRTNPHLSAAQVKSKVAEEQEQMLPGGRKEMVRRLIRTLDRNADGKITRMEWHMQWNDFAAEMFKLHEEKAIDTPCTIM